MSTVSTIWFTADTHFFHQNIIKYCSRPFSSVEEMNEYIIEQWNKHIKPIDRVYHLGDFAFKHGKNLSKIFDRLNGQKHLILGNHDNKKEVSKLKWNWIKDYYDLKIDKKKYIVLCHYPMRSWNRAFHGSYHLFGHVHSKLAPYGRSFDVGVDCWDFKPVPLETVHEVINKIEQKGLFSQLDYDPMYRWNGPKFLES